jgi:hypothetical protein
MEPIDFCKPIRVPPLTNHPSHLHHTRIPTHKGRSGEPEILRGHLVDASRPNSIVVGQLKESTRAQALQEVLDHLDLLRLLVAGVRWPLRHISHVRAFRDSLYKQVKQCKLGNTVGVRGLAGFFVPFIVGGVTLLDL